MELARELYEAASAGDEPEVRRLLAAGARPNQLVYGSSPLHTAAGEGHVRVVSLLLKTDPATALAVNSAGFTALHCAASRGNIGVIRMLLEAAPAAATVLNDIQWAPIHRAAYWGHAAVVQLLLEVAPEVAYALDADGETPLHLALRNAAQCPAEQVEETARCLVRAAPAVQPALGAMVQYNQHSATLFADLVASLPLSQEQWQSIPAPCPDLARAPPVVLERSSAEAGWLVGRLAEEQQARLRAAALSLARAQQSSNAVLPAELSGRILALCLLHP